MGCVGRRGGSFLGILLFGIGEKGFGKGHRRVSGSVPSRVLRANGCDGCLDLRLAAEAAERRRSALVGCIGMVPDRWT